MPDRRGNIAEQGGLNIRVLGEIAVVRSGEALALPPSKKTRALLAYLAVTGRPHRRERLCSLLWDVTDDPRAALRWSLSKLRRLVDEEGAARIVATRDAVAFERAGAEVDLLSLRTQLAGGVAAAPTEQLALAAREFGGVFLEDLDLPDFHDFQAWCVAEREAARTLHAGVLAALVERLAPRPDEALAHARVLVQVDPFNPAAHVALVRMLAQAGHRAEAEQRYESGRRVLEETGPHAAAALIKLWREATARPGRIETPPAAPEAPAQPAAGAVGIVPGDDGAPPLVGRMAERDELIALLADVTERRHEHVVLVSGEPGIGKSRLLAELMAAARARGGTVLHGCAYEVEQGRPYGPWIDALRQVSAAAVGEVLAADLAPLLPELAGASPAGQSRDRLFGAVVELIAARAHSAAPVLLCLDDVQWLDAASAELTHYVLRMCRHRPVLVALAAREAELPDNAPMLRMLRNLRRDQPFTDIRLAALDREHTARLAAMIAPGIDPYRVFADSAGNPLFALELARASQLQETELPRTLGELVRDRVERLPPAAVEVLRWGAVLGHAFSPRKLAALTSAEAGDLAAALETLERHALLRASRDGHEPQGSYAFSHDVVRRAVYGEISEPRRRLMHARVARALQEADDPQGSLAADIVRHASLAGEAALAARACVAAGRRCLRLFANAEAEAFARRGMHHAGHLAEADRIRLELDLTHVAIGARRPAQPDAAARDIEALAEKALGHGAVEQARLGFHMVSYLRWESGDWSDAQRQMLRAELISRSADDRERMVGMAEAARCLAMLERDLGQAEILALEANALAARIGDEPTAIPVASGLLRYHEGRLDEAARLFDHARNLARRHGDRAGEFQALEHLIMLALQQGRRAEARTLSAELITLGSKLREGSEAPFARALAGLSRYAADDDDAVAALDDALDALRIVDAKHRLAYALTRAASVDLRDGAAARAQERAAEALEMARLLDRPSEIALSLVVLVGAARALGEEAEAERHIDALRRMPLRRLAAHVRQAVASLGDFATSPGGTMASTGA